jgi:protein TonB
MMSAIANLTREERLGLGVAVAAHVALVVGLMLQPSKRDAVPVPDRMSVSLADEVSLESTSPDASDEPAAAIAPVLAPEPAPVVEPQPRTVERPVRQPPPRVDPRAQAKPKPPVSAAKTKPGGGTRIGADFLPGTSDGDQVAAQGTPAKFGPAEAASLNSAISRQLRPHWSAPQGADAEDLVTKVRFRLNQDGSLAGEPTCVSQSGITPSNAAQKGLHCERAIRAVRLAAPFDLPEQFYDKWKTINSTFDRRL